MMLIEIVAIDFDRASCAGGVSVKLSSVPPEEWVRFFGQAWILAVVERAIPADFAQGASVRRDRIILPGVSSDAAARQMGALRRVVDETNRIAAGYEALQRRSHEAP